MSARPVIQTYRLASLHEAAIARLKNPKNDRYKELYLQNRGIGEKVYNAVLSGRLDLACFCGDSSKYYSVLTRSTRQDGALQVTEIDRKGPIGHRLLTGPKQLELPGCGATVAAVSDVSRCTEQEILDAVGLQVAYIRSYIMKHTWAHCAKDDNSHLKANFTAKKIFQKTNGFAQWATIRQSLTMSYCVENLKQGRKPELTIFTSKKRTFPQAFSVRFRCL